MTENTNTATDLLTSPSMGPSLDLVRDCSDLDGTFPANVDLKFIYWRHGQRAQDYATENVQMDTNAVKLAPHLLDADVIGTEVHSSAHESPEGVYAEFEIINKMISGMVRHNTSDPTQVFTQRQIRNMYKNVCQTYYSHECVKLATAIWAHTGIKELQFFPFDKMSPKTRAVDDKPANKSDAAATNGKEPSNLEEYLLNELVDYRDRESLALRQIHTEATDLAEDEKPHKMAIIYGAMHTPVSVAARQLGANVERVFLDGTPNIVSWLIVRQLRYAQDPKEIKSIIDQGEKAIGEGILIMKIAESSGNPPDPKNRAKIANDVESFAYRAVRGKLPARQQRVYSENSGIIDAADDTDIKDLPRNKQRKLFKASQRLISLATNP